MANQEAAAPQEAAGTLLLNYPLKIDSCHALPGRGGIGIVLRAQQTSLDRPVATFPLLQPVAALASIFLFVLVLVNISLVIWRYRAWRKKEFPG